MDLDSIQSAIRDAFLDGWLFYDHHHRDPLAARILGLSSACHTTRRWYYFIPASGDPRKLVHRIESAQLDSLPGAKTEYSSWQELESHLEAMLSGAARIAMQYSPRNAILYVSMVDAGTVELVRSFGKEIISSADLVAQFEAILTDAQIASHYAAQQEIDAILAAAWPHIDIRVCVAGSANAPQAGVTEFDIVEWLAEAMRREGLIWEHRPNVSAQENSANPHYEPPSSGSRTIRNGDFLLIDIWGKLAQPSAIYYDVTWTGVIGREPTEREQLVFSTVRAARDAAIAAIQTAFAANKPIAGFEADDAARAVIRHACFGEKFIHRTGHNIGTDLHGAGAHLDNLETHDTRRILANTCFSIEPGIYLPDDFGVRSEVNMITRPGSATVTGRIQTELVRI
jgi:Xaa-Pro aminopeptidase